MKPQNTNNKPKYYSTYSFIAQINSKTMEFVSEKEYEEYINPIEIIKKHFVQYDMLHFRKKIVFYKRKSDGLYFVYLASQYFHDKPMTEVYTFEDYWDAFCKYQSLGGR
jgi:hypothetical protein